MYFFEARRYSSGWAFSALDLRALFVQNRRFVSTSRTPDRCRNRRASLPARSPSIPGARAKICPGGAERNLDNVHSRGEGVADAFAPWGTSWNVENGELSLPDAFLCPLEIPLGFPGGLESFVEIGSQAFHAALGHGLQLHQFLLLSVQLAGSDLRAIVSLKYFILIIAEKFALGIWLLRAFVARSCQSRNDDIRGGLLV